MRYRVGQAVRSDPRADASRSFRSGARVCISMLLANVDSNVVLCGRPALTVDLPRRRRPVRTS